MCVMSDTGEVEAGGSWVPGRLGDMGDSNLNLRKKWRRWKIRNCESESVRAVYPFNMGRGKHPHPNLPVCPPQSRLGLALSTPASSATSHLSGQVPQQEIYLWERWGGAPGWGIRDCSAGHSSWARRILWGKERGMETLNLGKFDYDRKKLLGLCRRPAPEAIGNMRERTIK